MSHTVRPAVVPRWSDDREHGGRAGGGAADDDAIGLRCGDDRWTWREIVTVSTDRARRLASLRRDGPFHVGVLLANSPDYLFTLFGAALAGAALVGINDTRRGAELVRDITHTDCQVVLTDAAHADLLDGLDLGGTPVHRVEEPFGDPSLGSLGTPTPEDLFVLIFTSGSTGSPKAVRMTHARAVPGRHPVRLGRCRRRALQRHAAVPRQRTQRDRPAGPRRWRHHRAAPEVLRLAVHARRAPLRRHVLQHGRSGPVLRARHPARPPTTATTG